MHYPEGVVFMIQEGSTRAGEHSMVAWCDEWAQHVPVMDVQDRSYGVEEFAGFARIQCALAGLRSQMPEVPVKGNEAKDWIGGHTFGWHVVLIKGTVHVFKDGYLTAQVHPHGGRNPRKLPFGKAE